MSGHYETKVLVVEDEPLIRLNAVAIMEDAGFEVEHAADSAEAMTILRAIPDLHVVFTDVNMPGEMDGIALAHFIAERHPTIGLIIVSGHTNLYAQKLPKGAVFLAKPYHAKSVVEHVHRVKWAA